jgi:hypothetical protein
MGGGTPPGPGPRVVRLSLRALVLGPIRAALSALGLLGSLAVGGGPSGALLGWALGAGLIVMFLAADPRNRRRRTRPEPLPPDAMRESWSQIARADVFPSTVTLAVATGIVLPFDSVLSAFLAGILGGMAIMSMVSRLILAALERRHGGALYLERGGERLFVVARPAH